MLISLFYLKHTHSADYPAVMWHGRSLRPLAQIFFYPDLMVLESFHRKLKYRIYRCKSRSIMLLLWQRTPIRFTYPKKDSSWKQELTLAGFNLVLRISIWIWSTEWCFGRSRNKSRCSWKQREAKCCHAIRCMCRSWLHSCVLQTGPWSWAQRTRKNECYIHYHLYTNTPVQNLRIYIYFLYIYIHISLSMICKRVQNINIRRYKYRYRHIFKCTHCNHTHNNMHTCIHAQLPNR